MVNKNADIFYSSYRISVAKVTRPLFKKIIYYR